jgi:hypothetical protein
MDGVESLFKSKAELKAEKEAAKAKKKLEKSKVRQPLLLQSSNAHAGLTLCSNCGLGSPMCQVTTCRRSLPVPVGATQLRGIPQCTCQLAAAALSVAGPSTPWPCCYPSCTQHERLTRDTRFVCAELHQREELGQVCQ